MLPCGEYGDGCTDSLCEHISYVDVTCLSCCAANISVVIAFPHFQITFNSCFSDNMPTLSKLAKHGAVLTAVGVGLGAAVYLVQDLIRSGSSKECLHAIAAGAAVVGIGGGITFYVCRAIGCECVSDGDAAKVPAASSVGGTQDMGLKSFQERGKANPLVQYAFEHSHVHPVVRQLHKETMKLPESMMASALESCTFLTVLARALDAKQVLDIGVFTGLSTLSLALGVTDDGKVVSCELEDNADVDLGRKYWKAAGVDGKVELHFRPAAETLQELIDRGECGTFDMAFIDADKPNYTLYFKLCYQLLRSGGLMVVDNTLWDGRVIDARDNSEKTVAMRMLNETVRSDDRVRAVMLLLGDGQTVIQKL